MGVHKEAVQTYSFPLLTPEEIVLCMNELQCPIDVNELAEPRPEPVCTAYLQLAEHCMGITREELSQPAFQGLSALTYPELHEDSIPRLAFFRAV